MKTPRNKPCPCGSGHKFKKCCLEVPKAKPPEPPPLEPKSEQPVRRLRSISPLLVAALAMGAWGSPTRRI